MKRLQASACSIVLLGLGAVHVYWAAGGDRYAEASVPSLPTGADGAETPVLTPGPASTLVVAAALTGASVAVSVAGFAGRQRWLANLVALAFLLRGVGEFRYVGVFKRVRGTTFSRRDDFVYSPLCFAISALARGAAR